MKQYIEKLPIKDEFGKINLIEIETIFYIVNTNCHCSCQLLLVV